MFVRGCVLIQNDFYATLFYLKQKLIPVLRTKSLPAKKDDDAFAANLVAECKSLLLPLFPLRQNEVEFISLLREEGEIKPSLLTKNHSMIETKGIRLY